VIDLNDERLQVALEATDRAATRGIHVLWLASYELASMLPHLQRLGYHHAYIEGPTRFVAAGPHQDAAAFDPVFWKGITGAFGDLVAKHSLDHAIEGIMFDTEHYDGGMMYLQGCGFADISFDRYLQARDIGKTLTDIPAGTRYEYLKREGLLHDYLNFMEEQAFDQGRYLAERWRSVNPHLMIGTWPCFDNWFAQGMLRGMGGATRSIGLSGVEYFHGSEQTPAMAEYFESINPNLKYCPGFYPPYSYKPAQLEQHVAYAIKTVGAYWMLSPYGAVSRDDYRQALRSAYEKSTVPISQEKPSVNLIYRMEKRDVGRVLLVKTQEPREHFTAAPKLSLRAAFGGAELCEALPMTESVDGCYRVEVQLERKLTNNRHLADGFRSGATYHYDPIPHETFYEDPKHTKLCDGRAYGYFGTTIAWPKEIDSSEVIFDLHRCYHITKVLIAQPSKLEDRHGGPTQLEVNLAVEKDSWISSAPLKAVFSVWTQKDEEPIPRSFVKDKRHQRAWLSWTTDAIDKPARWVRVQLKRVRPNSYLSLGQVVISGIFDGDIQASLQDGNEMRMIANGRRVLVPRQ